MPKVRFRKQPVTYLVNYKEYHPFEMDGRQRYTRHYRRLDNKFKSIDEAKAAITQLVERSEHPLDKIEIRTNARIKVLSDHMKGIKSYG